MSWSARIEHTDGGLRLRFPEPLTTLDMTNDVAEHLATLLAVEARSPVRGVVRALEAQSMLYVDTGATHPLCCDCDGCLNGVHQID